MAAKKVIFEDEELFEETSEVTEESINEAFKPLKVSRILKEDSVEVTPLRDFPCSYGGERYFFTKGKKQSVPREVAEFLLRNTQSPKIRDYR